MRCIAIGTFIFWAAGFISHYAPLYTLYWPLPADFTQFSVSAVHSLSLGIAIVMVGTVLFVINILKLLLYTPDGLEKQPAVLNWVRHLVKWIRKSFYEKGKKEHLVSLPVAAIARGTVDAALNAAVILFTGVLILVYMIAELLGIQSEGFFD